MYLPSDNNTVCIRLLRPGFEYPDHSFKHHDALYYPSKEVVFLVTKRQSSNYGHDIYTEVAIWDPEEIQLLGALTLSVPEGGGMVVFAPWHFSPLPLIPLIADLSSDSIIKSCLEAAIALRVKEEKQPERNIYMIRTVNCSDPNTEKALFENINPRDGILIRGLYSLIKSQLLMHEQDFMEEAFMNLQISREAALQMIRELLHFLGNPNPSYQEAHDYIRTNFQLGEELVEYLEEQHEKWIETKHPLNVYGAAWAPSLSADDIFETYECLISIYRHIVLGEQGRSSLITTTS